MNNENLKDKIKSILDDCCDCSMNLAQYLKIKIDYHIGYNSLSYNHRSIDELYLDSLRKFYREIRRSDIYNTTQTNQDFFKILRTIHTIVKDEPHYLENLNHVRKSINDMKSLEFMYWGTREVIINITNIALYNSYIYPEKKSGLLYRDETLLYEVLMRLKLNKDILRDAHIKVGINNEDYKVYHLKLFWTDEDLDNYSISLRQKYISLLVSKVFDKMSDSDIFNYYTYRDSAEFIEMIAKELLIQWECMSMLESIPINQVEKKVIKF